jgi:hypothetical protein
MRITGEELFALWTPLLGQSPDASPDWSSWAKPVLFAEMGVVAVDDFPSAPADLAVGQMSVSGPEGRWAIVVDLPGARSVDQGVALAAKGWAPVPLYNACSGPGAVIETQSLKDALVRAVAALRTIQFNVDAPPAFLLDSRRTAAAPKPGDFDNRWVVLPQDFPSAALLRSRGIAHVLLIQQGRSQPQADLAHVLLRWQQSGLGIFVRNPEEDDVEAITVTRPSRFRALCYALLATIGLRRSSAGGFGGRVPMPSSSGGGYG